MSNGVWNTIERDPYEMLAYSKSLKQSVDTLITTLTQTVNRVSAYKTELDADCQNSIDGLYETMKMLRVQLDEYANLAKMLENNANYILNRPKL